MVPASRLAAASCCNMWSLICVDYKGLLLWEAQMCTVWQNHICHSHFLCPTNSVCLLGCVEVPIEPIGLEHGKLPF